MHFIYHIICLFAIILLLKTVLVLSKLEGFRTNETSKWAVVQFDNRPLSDDYQKLVELNKKYCHMYAYDHYFYSNEYNHITPYWAKIHAVQNVLNMKNGDSPKYAGVLWIDTDAVIDNTKIKLNDVSSKDFFCSGDPPLWHSPFNAGVWGVRSTPIGYKIINKWIELYNAVSTAWSTDSTGAWKSTGGWAGNTYEQGAFIENILHSEAFRNHIDILPWEYLQDIKHTDKSITLHFAGKRNAELRDYLATVKY
jgi:hypothetical protein